MSKVILFILIFLGIVITALALKAALSWHWWFSVVLDAAMLILFCVLAVDVVRQRRLSDAK